MAWMKASIRAPAPSGSLVGMPGVTWSNAPACPQPQRTR